MRRKATLVDCPHCGRTLSVAHMPRHLAGCLRNPAVRERVAAALTDQDAPAYAVGQQEYELAATRLRLPAPNTLRAAFGDWVEACAAFGLLPATQKPYVPRPHRQGEAARARSDARDAVIMAELVQADAVRAAEFSRGLPVCGRRELPDGRVAWVLR